MQFFPPMEGNYVFPQPPPQSTFSRKLMWLHPSLNWTDRATSFQRSSLFLPREMTLVTAGHVTAHNKLLPSRGTLAPLFYSQEPNL